MLLDSVWSTEDKAIEQAQTLVDEDFVQVWAMEIDNPKGDGALLYEFFNMETNVE